MKKFILLFFFLFIAIFSNSQTISKEVFSFQLGNKKIFEIKPADTTIHYEFYYTDERYPSLKHYEYIYFDNFESISLFFNTADSLYKKYNPGDKESVSIMIDDINVYIRWSFGIKFIYIYSNKNDSYFTLTQNMLNRINGFLDKYAKQKK